MTFEIAGDGVIVVRDGLEVMDPRRRQVVYPGDQIPADVPADQLAELTQLLAECHARNLVTAAEDEERNRIVLEAEAEALAKEQAEKDAAFIAEVRRQLIAAGILK